ncbi:acyl-coenzyme A synthetase ACSM1, mitochondrial isoform X5 [Meriones unguiculatus]|uniref:acyl-coenzyme A synthetase ACSM1, mitochondrial isoform X5 n=1 Tax=Meriones unguiculatus TaxID=10047 RepID=UPI00293F3F88|nr:acyl-coenzyme A synthetase ACSM1, mitochondrial isoform X5 [Meriones unguiculatus]
MQWLMKIQISRGICKFIHSFSLGPFQLHSRSFSGAGTQRWNDYDSPEEFNFANDVLDNWAQMEEEGKRGPSPALWWVNGQGEEIKWSFRDLRDVTRRAANAFEQSCGLQQGDRLALILPRVPEWWLVTIGCLRTGVVFMPGTTQLKAKDILYRLQMSQAKAIVTTDSLIPEVESIVSECPALKTKLVVSDRSHEGWLNFRSLVNRKFLKLKMSDVIWCMSDPGWILATIGGMLEPWTSGATLFIHELPQFDPKVIIETMFKYPITHCGAAPGVYRMILQQKMANLRFPTLKHCFTGGESLLPEEFEQWKQRTGILIHEVYGQSETIIDEKGNILPPNTEGYLGIRIKPTRPLGLFVEYENSPEKTSEVECGDFYNSGDRATVDEDGYFWFLGREDDIINASGYRIGPTEVENALAEHPAVAESAVVSSPDKNRGEVVKAFIVLNPEFLSHDQEQLTKELQQHVKSVTAPYKYPRKVEFVPELPKTVTGKIRRKELRNKEFGQI